MNRNEKGQFLPKGTMSLEDAVRLVYNEQPTTFHGIIIVERVRHLIGRELMYPDSALREMRRMKKRGETNFRCKNRELSIYEKLDVKIEA